MWFWLSLAALLCWSGSDLFSKTGCQEENERYAYLKMVSAVGLVMGLHALFTLITGKAQVTGEVMLRYLPVSALYIISMATGYLGMRYIELSILSPVCNSSGAVVVVLILLTSGFGTLPPVSLLAVALVCAGVISLGVTEAREDPERRMARQEEGGRRYSKSLLALLLPVLYCILDALGTFADARILETLDEGAANTAYELTFLLTGAVCAIYVFGIKKQKLIAKTDSRKLVAAVFETAGQAAYIVALSDTAHAALTVPVVSAYCVGSMLWGRIFLKERLSGKHYVSVAMVVAGIVIMGILDI